MRETKIEIGGKTWTWRYNMLTCMTISKTMNIVNPLDAFGMIRERGMDPEIIGGLIVSGIKYQPDENGRFADTGITPIDLLANMESDPKILLDIIEQIVDVVNDVRPTKAGRNNPAMEKARQQAEAPREMQD